MQGEGEDGDGDGDVVFVSRSGCSALLCAQASTGMRAAFAAFGATHVQAMEEKREVRRRGGGGCEGTTTRAASWREVTVAVAGS